MKRARPFRTRPPLLPEWTGRAGQVSRWLVADAALRGAGVVDIAGEQVRRRAFRRVGGREQRQDDATCRRGDELRRANARPGR